MRSHISDVAFTVDEHIWGHRLYDEQLPHLTVLEFLSVLQSNTADPMRREAGGKARYKPQRQIRLRSLLFNNPYVETIRARPIPDGDKWQEWEGFFLRDATVIEKGDLNHLREVFLSFDDFARAIELLRGSAFEGQSNKRWSSKFVFPFGPDALYEDLRFDAGGGASNDRRFFARTGEILYLMLCRAEKGKDLGLQLVGRVFNPATPLNRLVRALQGEPQFAPDYREVGYLPHESHPRFDSICEDWLSILSRDMPIYDALEHLIAAAGLNLLLYFIECGKSAAGDTDPVEIVCEIVSRERTKVRALSAESFQANQAVSLRAVRASVERVRVDPEWGRALASTDPKGECTRVLQERFQWPPESEEDGKTGEALIRELADEAESRHEQHFGKIHATWSRAIGLSSRRLSRSMRYAPNDRLLKTLVVTVVEERMEFGEFLHEIHRRYGLVIGDAEGEYLIRENLVDQEALSDNCKHLESRLMGLGLLRRLSDSCSFVENPFMRKGVA